MNFHLIQEYTKKVDTAFDVCDGKIAKYSEWQNLQGYHRVGMQHLSTGERHGAFRSVKPGEWIAEGSSRRGNTGIIRTIEAERVYFALYKDGAELASVSFDTELNEKERRGKRNLLDAITTESIRR